MLHRTGSHRDDRMIENAYRMIDKRNTQTITTDNNIRQSGKNKAPYNAPSTKP